ncbi:outer membrane protein (porin) [Herbaspirillum sp. YR522]|nr:porin [Herbaspirillum sp. YR522]EJN01802.1 outer membrane protein (porin) [Herbaspirillum sp. YR522]
MKQWMIGAVAIPALMAGAQAQAQSKFEIYGLISGGVGYLTNQGGPHNFEALSGTNQNPRIGFRGQEDLGGGTRAIMNLENGFNMMTGGASQNGRLFGRLSYVGLSSNSMGTLTLGRQYEAVKDYLGPVVIASNGVHIGDNDNGYNNLRVQNSVKYISPSFGNFNVTALYGFGEAAGDASINRVMSIGSGYKGGDFRWAVAYTQMDTPNSSRSPDGAMSNDYASSLLIFNKSLVSSAGVRRQRIAGTGGFYTVGKTDFGAMYSNVRYEYLDNTKLTLQNFDLNLVNHFTPALNLGASYFYTVGKYDTVNKKPKWHQINLQADYFLSKRTDVAITYSYQMAAGDATNATIFGFPSSSDKKQAVLMLGMRHVF